MYCYDPCKKKHEDWCQYDYFHKKDPCKRKHEDWCQQHWFNKKEEHHYYGYPKNNYIGDFQTDCHKCKKKFCHCCKRHF
ncbi:hypothetical protein D1B32_13805 [Oceanobacillus profundus]|uniref:Uncharacterized protein n=1 Tax=Oceanobacillus profundus TaxID=372463 RepID=A0A417YF41_9BACI|nr:hypothetical protein CHI07_13095 [Paenibacillus sp. 7884-2]RHW31272.1 hypothetical protein D1B32_13805 [Oceanobacillus profundus]